MHPELVRLQKLPVQEKLQVVEELWDDIAASKEPLTLPEWHREEAQRRAVDVDRDPSIGLSREQLWKQVDSANGTST